jgi:hypothetical protein
VSEDDLQRAVVEYIEIAHPKLWPVTFHCPSGLWARSKTQAKRMMSRGFKPGVPDLLILSVRRRQDEPVRHYGGFGLELKVGRNTPTPAQLAFLLALAANGLYAAWTNSFDTALALVNAYAALPHPDGADRVSRAAIEVLCGGVH